MINNAGLPDPKHLRWIRLLYSQAARSVVVHARVQTDARKFGAIYVRTLSQRKYRPLAVPDVGQTIESPLLAGAAPFLFYLVMSSRAVAGTLGQSTEELVRMNLVDGQRATIARLDLGKGSAGSIIEILGAAADGEHIFCSVGVPRGGRTGGRIDYFVSSINWAGRHVEHLTRLRSGYF